MKIKEQLVVIPSKEIIIGNPAAKVRLELFGDYESEASAKANAVVNELLSLFEGDLNYTFRHFPMTRIHQKAHKAAEAAIGAAQEGKFREMHELLFQHRLTLGVISLKSYAREVGVKDKKFLDHLINSDWGWYVQDDLREGLQRGVTNIPTIFINGQKVEKEPTVRNLRQVIEAALQETAARAVPLKQSKRA